MRYDLKETAKALRAHLLAAYQSAIGNGSIIPALQITMS